MTREEAIKCIQEEKLRYERAPLVNGCPMWEEWQKAIDICDMAISALRAQQEQESKPMNEWISVKDRLPRCGDRVIMTDGVFVCEAFLSISGKWVRNGIGWIESEITHWMPMPTPTKREKTEE